MDRIDVQGRYGALTSTRLEHSSTTHWCLAHHMTIRQDNTQICVHDDPCSLTAHAWLHVERVWEGGVDRDHCGNRAIYRSLPLIPVNLSGIGHDIGYPD